MGFKRIAFWPQCVRMCWLRRCRLFWYLLYGAGACGSCNMGAALFMDQHWVAGEGKLHWMARQVLAATAGCLQQRALFDSIVTELMLLLNVEASMLWSAAGMLVAGLPLTLLPM